MSYWIQIRKTGIYFCSTVTSVREVDLNCPLDCEKCSDEVLEDWAREEAAKYGNCEIYDKYGTYLVGDDDTEELKWALDPGYKWSGYLGQD